MPTPPRKPPTATPAPVTPATTPLTLVNSTENPAGAPEGTDHAHVGTLAETPGVPVASPPTQPAQADLGTTAITTEDPEPTLEPTVDPLVVLEAYLRAHHPGDVTEDEHVALTATRLLTRLGARGDALARCTAPYCNLPVLHHGEHGWVHVEPSAAR